MSMVGKYLRIEPALLDMLRKTPKQIVDVIHGSLRPSADRALDIDKSWHGIHYLLTGDPWEGPLPLRNVVLGGVPIGKVNLGYGPARYLTPEQVREVASALGAVSGAELTARFNPAAMMKAEIYPQAWDDGEDELEYLLHYYELLVAFFAQAAADGDAVLCYIS